MDLEPMVFTIQHGFIDLPNIPGFVKIAANWAVTHLSTKLKASFPVPDPFKTGGGTCLNASGVLLHRICCAIDAVQTFEEFCHWGVCCQLFGESTRSNKKKTHREPNTLFFYEL